MSKPEPDALRQIALDRIHPGPQQARRQFDETALEALAQSLRESGLVQPVVLRPRAGGGYELLAGERRWRAAQRAGWRHIAAWVREDLDDDEARVLGLVENLQRESLSPIEAAEGLRRLAESAGLTHEQVGQRIGKSREYVSNHLRLLKLDPGVQRLVDGGTLELGHAKVLAGLLPAEQRRLAADVATLNLSVRQLERRARREPAAAPTPSRGDADQRRLEQRLSDQLGCPVQLLADAAGRGELRLRFHSLDELDGLLARLGHEP